MYFYTVLGIGFLFFIFLKIRKPPDKKSKPSVAEVVLPKVKKKNDWTSGQIMSIITILGSVGIIAYFATSAVTTISGHINDNLVVQVDLSRNKETTAKQDGKASNVKIGIQGVIHARIRATNVQKDGYNVVWACPTIPALKGVVDIKFEQIGGARSVVKTIELTEESKVKLLKLGITTVNVSVTPVLHPYKAANPCSHMAYVPK